jgi:hypothetical protein
LSVAALAGIDGQPRQILGWKQSWLGIGFEFSFDVLAEIAKTLESLLIEGDADVAQHPLAGLAILAVTRDELD